MTEWTDDELSDILTVIDYGWYESTKLGFRVEERDKTIAKLRSVVSGEMLSRTLKKALEKA